jgi:hypothetical protein
MSEPVKGSLQLLRRLSCDLLLFFFRLLLLNDTHSLPSTLQRILYLLSSLGQKRDRRVVRRLIARVLMTLLSVEDTTEDVVLNDAGSSCEAIFDLLELGAEGTDGSVQVGFGG